MSDDIQLANLLLTMQSSIRGDIREAKTDLSTQIAGVRAKQEEHDGRLTALEERTRPSGVLELTPRQKKVLWGAAIAVGGAVLEGLRHIGGWVVAAVTHGVRTP